MRGFKMSIQRETTHILYIMYRNLRLFSVLKNSTTPCVVSEKGAINTSTELVAIFRAGRMSSEAFHIVHVPGY